MAPWDELQYFDDPTRRFIILTSLSQFVLPADPRRVLLGFATTDSVQLILAPESANGTAGQSIGFPLYNGIQPYIFRHKDDAPLPSIAWTVSNPSATTTTVYILEQRMKDWPTVKRGA
jgi:hypothetical protein